MTASALEARPAAMPAAKRAHGSWLLVFALMLAYLLNHADRNIFVIVAPLIQAEFGLSDGQLGLLTGAAFALLYSICGVPLGYLADRASRRILLVGTLLLWSTLTAATGLAMTTLQLALMRVLVGVGEAGCAPASHSLLGQHLTGSRRALGLAVFGIGAPLGMAVAFAAGSVVAAAHGWRTAFVALGALGLPVAVLLWFVVSPALDAHEKRAGSAVNGPIVKGPSQLSQGLELVRDPAFLSLLMANGMLFVAFGAALQWMPVFLHRVHGMPVGELGPWLGLAAGVPSILGNLAGAGIAVKWRMEDAPGLMKIALAASACGLPLLLAALFAGSAFWVLILLALALATTAGTTGPNYAAAQELAGQGRRALGAALLLLVANLVGLGLGTYVIGAVSDALAGPLGAAQGLRMAIFLLVAGSGALAIVAYGLAIRNAARRAPGPVRL